MSMKTIEEIKARLQGLSKQTKKQSNIWKPKDEHTIRCLPYPHGDDPFVVLGFHYDIGGQSILCPKTNFDKECVICETAEELRAWKDQDGNDKPEQRRKEDWELFKHISVKERYFVAMVERGKESEGAKFYSFGKSTYERLLGFCIDKKLNNAVKGEGTDVLCSVTEAFDLHLNFKQASNKDGKGNTKTFPVTDIEIAELKPTPLAESKAAIQKILDSVPHMKTVYPEVSPAEVKTLYLKFINSQTAEQSGEEGSVGTEISANTAEKPVEGGMSIDEAFGELAD